MKPKKPLVVQFQGIEALENRAMLASVSLAAGVLTITGNSTADHIEVQNRSDKGGKLRVEINGGERDYNLASVSKIVINALGGNDWVEYSGRNGGLSIPGVIDGGDGNDTLQGGNGNDSISGGANSDRIEGKGGNDFLTGNGGNDYIQGGDGDDRIRGLDGNDRLYGGSGYDRLEGGNGDDDLTGNGNSDSLYGGSGNDDFFDIANQAKDHGGADDGPNHT